MKPSYKIAPEVFRILPDPRVERTEVHSLEVIMFIALCTYLSGGESFYDMADYAGARKDWLKEAIGMQSVLSHDTFNRVFQAISPESFGQCLIELPGACGKKFLARWSPLTGKRIAEAAGKVMQLCMRLMPGR